MKNGFMDDGEIIDDMLSRMSALDKHICAHTLEKDLIRFHHCVGRDIRNHYRLWDEKNPFAGTDHPDDRSQRIIVGIWKKLNDVS